MARPVVAVVVAVVTIIAFESMSITTIMPGVASALGVGGGYGLAFSLMFTAELLGIVVASVWIDRSGALAPVRGGLVLFALGSTLAGLAPTYGVLLAGRVVAGAGAGLVTVALYVVIGAVFDEEGRRRVMAWMSTAWVLPSVVGPVLAALMAEHLGWRSVFLVVLPLSVAVGAGMLRLGPRLSAAARTETSDPAEAPVADRLGHGRVARLGVLVAVAAGAFQWGSSQLVPPSPVASAATVVGALGTAYAAIRLLPPGTVRLRRGLPALNASRFCLMAAFNGLVAFGPLAFVTTRGLDMTGAGLVIMTVSLGWSAGSWVPTRTGLRAPALVALGSFVVFGGALLATLLMGAAGLPAWAFVVPLVVMGIGMGITTASMNVHMLALTTPPERPSASSSLQLADVLGSAIGIATCGALYAAGRDALPPVTLFTLVWAAAALLGLCSWVAGRRSDAAEDVARR